MIINIYLYNLYTGSFLEEGFDKWMKEKGIDGFDIIVGNPPYNDDGGLKTGGKNLYQKFILKSLDLYKKYMLFVTPPGFYKTTNFDEPNKIFKKINEKNSLVYLNNSDISKKYFNVGTLIVYYLISKEKYQNTLIENEYGKFKINILKFNFIPRIATDKTYNILDKISSKGVRMIISRDDKKLKKIDKFATLSTLNHLNQNGKWNVSVGSKSNRKRIIIEHNNPEYLVKILNLKLYRYIFYTYRHDGAVYHNFLIGFKIPNNIKNINNDKDLYKYFNLTDEEIKLIEETVK